ncbi:hypothetical protein EDB19DRAFT_1836068 [Suillus lakei]|nr:hypothetical protein EDB19DRAFT_1836068 [Suillus lakei]
MPNCQYKTIQGTTGGLRWPSVLKFLSLFSFVDFDIFVTVPVVPVELSWCGARRQALLRAISPVPLCLRYPTFSSREDSDEEDEIGIVFADAADDEDDRLEDEFITSFKAYVLLPSFSVNGKKPKTQAPSGPLVIPSKSNPGWRQAAWKCRAGVARFIPDSAKATTDADGSVGGLWTHHMMEQWFIDELKEGHAKRAEKVEVRKQRKAAREVKTWQGCRAGDTVE